MKKPRLSFWQIWNMSFGFLGIQFGWGLQLANMSPIYKYLHAEDSLPYPLARWSNHWSDQSTHHRFDERSHLEPARTSPSVFSCRRNPREYRAFFMPDSSAVWMAAGLLWILDASINITMEPFRAFVADKLPEEQRTLGFVMQSFFIGIGQTLANALPLFVYGAGRGWRYGESVPGFRCHVDYSFKIGAIVFLVAVLWTVITTKEYPPEDMEAV